MVCCQLTVTLARCNTHAGWCNMRFAVLKGQQYKMSPQGSGRVPLRVADLRGCDKEEHDIFLQHQVINMDGHLPLLCSSHGAGVCAPPTLHAPMRGLHAELQVCAALVRMCSLKISLQPAGAALALCTVHINHPP